METAEGGTAVEPPSCFIMTTCYTVGPAKMIGVLEGSVIQSS